MLYTETVFQLEISLLTDKQLQQKLQCALSEKQYQQVLEEIEHRNRSKR